MPLNHELGPRATREEYRHKLEQIKWAEAHRSAHSVDPHRPSLPPEGFEPEETPSQASVLFALGLCGLALIVAIAALLSCGTAAQVGGSFDVKIPPDGGPVTVDAEGHFDYGPLHIEAGTDGFGACLDWPFRACFKWPLQGQGCVEEKIKMGPRPGRPDPNRAPGGIQRGMVTYWLKL